jgi:hypothetical protein
MAVTQMIIGVAAMVVPLLIQMLLEEYGFRGTQAVIAAFSLHAMLGMVVQQPVKYHTKKKKTLISSPSDFIRRQSADIIVHSERAWNSEIQEGNEVNIRIQQHRSEVGKDSEVNITINQHHSEVKATAHSSSINQELINIQFQNKNMYVDSLELKDAGESKKWPETQSDKEIDHEGAENGDESRVNSETDTPDEHALLVRSGHTKKSGHVTAEIGITVKTADELAVNTLPRRSSQVSIPVMNRQKEAYRVRYDSIRDATSLESYESRDG